MGTVIRHAQPEVVRHAQPEVEPRHHEQLRRPAPQSTQPWRDTHSAQYGRRWRNNFNRGGWQQHWNHNQWGSTWSSNDRWSNSWDADWRGYGSNGYAPASSSSAAP